MSAARPSGRCRRWRPTTRSASSWRAPRPSGAPIELSDDEHGVIADICARLDGLPLAIELAAARTRAFPITQIAARLNDRFRLLTGGSRTALPRQQTLRAVVDWSYELLFDDEQRVFERLAVFPGGCDLATAEAVCADDDIAAADVADHLQRPGRQVAGGRRARRRRACGSPSCRRSPSTAGSGSPNGATRCASATRWPGTSPQLCAQSAAAFTGDEQRAWLTAIDQEHDNLRAALDWAVANDDAETALHDRRRRRLAALADRHGGRRPSAGSTTRSPAGARPTSARARWR